MTTLASEAASKFSSRPDDMARLTAEARCQRVEQQWHYFRKITPAALQAASQACAEWERIEKGGRG